MKKWYSKLSPWQLMGGVLILPEPKNAKKTDNFHLKKPSRQPMGVNKVATFEKLTNFTENSTRVESSS
jgi:hypothetical protein